MMFPSVWSSLFRVNKHAFGTFVSLVMLIFFSPSNSRKDSKAGGAFIFSQCDDAPPGSDADERSQRFRVSSVFIQRKTKIKSIINIDQIFALIFLCIFDRYSGTFICTSALLILCLFRNSLWTNHSVVTSRTSFSLVHRSCLFLKVGSWLAFCEKQSPFKLGGGSVWLSISVTAEQIYTVSENATRFSTV